MKKTPVLIAALAAASIALSACASTNADDAMEASPTAMSSDKMSDKAMDSSMEPSGGAMESDSANTGDAMAMHGSLISRETYDADPAAYADTTIVYLFHADWCPTCKATEAALADGSVTVPAKVTLVQVDFDKATDLRKTYGVTMQHTLVQVDSSGMLVAKWTPGSSTELFDGLTT